MSATASVGALDEDQTKRSVRRALDDLQQCVGEAVQRLSTIAGSIELAVLVDSKGRADRVWAKSSTLGDRTTEKCMFGALEAVAWPKPVGGPVGEASTAFEFDLPRGVETPMALQPDAIAETLEALAEPLRACRLASSRGGRIAITMYVGKDGRPLAAGAETDRKVSSSEVDCLIDELLRGQYPPPEKAPAKVRFEL